MRNYKIVLGTLALVLALTLVSAACGKNPEKMRAQFEQLAGQVEAAETGGDMAEAAKLSRDALRLAKEMQKAGLVDTDAVDDWESAVKFYNAQSGKAAPAPASDMSKDGKAIAEKIQALQKEIGAIREKIMRDTISQMGMNETAGRVAGMAIYEATSKIDNQIKALYELADQLSDREYRRYVETWGKLPEKELEYGLTRDGKGVNISAYNGLGGKVIIPAELEGFPVIEMSISEDKWGEHRKRITSAVIPGAVTQLPTALPPSEDRRF